MTATTAHDPNPFLGTAAGQALLVQLRRTTDGRTGDRLSAAIRAVTTAGSTLPTEEVDAALTAITLLLAEYQPTLLDGAPDEQALRSWLRQVDTELTPGRRMAAGAALVRIEIDLDNQWYDAHLADGSVQLLLDEVHRLRNALADAAG
ncbi:MAG TPA: hypothetical protein VIC62_08965 [Nakamurella sp.]|jgi:hypothetical protein